MASNFTVNFQKSIIGQFTKNLTQLMPLKMAVAISLMVLMSFSEAVSLFILVPLLQLVGLDVGQGSLGQINELVLAFFNALGIQPTLIFVLGLYVIIISVSAILLRWRTMTSHEIQYKFAAHLRKRLYQAITSSSWLFFIRIKSSDLTHALTNEIERISTGTYMFLNLIASIMILAVYVIFALKLAGIISGIIFMVGVVILLLLRSKVRKSQSSGEEITTTTRDLYSSIIQHLDGMKTIKSFDMEDENVKLFSKQTDQVALRYLNTIRSYANVKLLFDIGTVIVLAIMVLVLIQIIQIPTATLLLLIYIFVRMIPQFSSIQNSYQYFITMLPAFSNVMKLERDCIKNSELSEVGKKDRFDVDVEFKKEISLEHVSFTYRDEHHFKIIDLNLMIPAGKITAIVGQSGAGKSTIADLVMGLIKPDNGKITLDGTPLKSNVSWKNRIGYVAQDTFLFNESVRFNLLLARSKAKEKDLTDVLEMAAAYQFVSKLPDGMDTLIGDRGIHLSGGERQRLALARALLRRPSLLILDEATSNLDSENEARILNAIENLHGEMTILMIAHRLSTIRNADYIYLMEDGMVREAGTWDSLIKKEKGKFRRLYEIQS